MRNLELNILGLDGCDSWHDISYTDSEYQECEGDKMINWKTEGYSKFLQILMVKIFYFISE